MFVISGATGNTGSVVAQSLLEQGQDVRVIVRSEEKAAIWKKKGAQTAIAELTDLDAMVAALEGAEGAYFLLPPDLSSETFLEDSIARADLIVQAAEKARLPHAVILSSVGAQFEDKVGPISTVSYFEKLFKSSPIPVTAVRPGYFLDNIQDVLPAALHDGIYPSMFHPLDMKIDMVSTQDIGLKIVEALLNPPSISHRVVELKGAKQYSAEDIAAALSHSLRRDIQPLALPQEQWVEVLMQSGLSQQSARSIAEMHENINNGRIDFLDAGAQKGTIDLQTYTNKLVEQLH